MANAQHLEWLLEGVKAWNRRRKENSDMSVDLAGSDLSGASLNRVNLRDANLADANLSGASLIGANLRDANLTGANLSGSFLTRAKLTRSTLIYANLTDAYLARARLFRAKLSRANLTSANLVDAVLIETYLDNAILAGANFTGANFTGARLSNANLSGAQIRMANFTNARLVNANLAGSKLVSANLVDADLTGTSLVDADLTAANLTAAALTDANLTDAILFSADLKNATLTSANCTQADFGGANLVGVNLTKVQFRHTNFFGNNKLSQLYQDTNAHPESVTGVIDIVNSIKEHHKTHGNNFDVYFRGEAKNTWPLRPSVMRNDSYKSNEHNMLLGLIARRPGDFNGVVSGVGQLVLAQHHGLKTRFLDITRNPLVALFHACAEKQYINEDAKIHVFVAPNHMIKPFISDTVSVVANYARLPEHHQKALIGHHNDNSNYLTALGRLFQMIQSEKPYFESRIDPKDFYRVIIVEPQQLSERISKQAGAFLVSAFHERFERKEIEARGEGVPPLYAHYQLTIPSSAKKTILEELKMLDITRESLFPGLDESANAVNEFYSRRSE